jgi:parvulin-like peptidyl-prolyl isomerase
MSIGGAVDGGTTGSDVGMKDRVLGFLIFSRWLRGEARELGVRVSEGEARKQLELLRFDQIERRQYEGLPREPELSRFLVAPAVGVSDRLWLMKLSILAARIEQMRALQALHEVTKSQIARYYDENRSRLLVPESRDLEIIMTKHEAGVRKAKREIESGKSFLSVAKRTNVSPEGGLHLGLARGAGEKLFENVVFTAKQHVLLGPVKQQLFYIFEVLKITPAKEQTLVRAQASIRKLLAARLALPRLMRAVEAKWIARTSCLPAYVVEKCRQYKAAPRLGVARPYS